MWGGQGSKRTVEPLGGGGGYVQYKIKNKNIFCSIVMNSSLKLDNIVDCVSETI
jgi:hypothetical protein